MNPTKTCALVRAVRNRQWLIVVARQFQFFSLVLAALYALLLLLSRVLGLIPNWFIPLTLFAVPAGALLLAVIFHRRPAETHSARQIDAHERTDDLFLTALLIEHAVGEYQPLVLRRAEEKTAAVRLREVVRYRWWPGTGYVAGVLAVLLAGALYLPQLDPFGKDKERQRLEQRRQALREETKATALRAAMLQKKDLEREHSEAIEKTIAELKQAFNVMKPTNTEANLRRLAEEQKFVGQMWRQMNQQKLKDASNPTSLPQKVGSDNQKLAQWKSELEKGQASSLKREMEDLKKLAKELEQKPEGAEKDKMRNELKQRLQTLAEFVAQTTNSEQTKAAVARALEDVDLSKLKGLSQDALKGLQSALNLTDQELANLSQAARDLQSLEEALKAIQMAKMLNNTGWKQGFG